MAFDFSNFLSNLNNMGFFDFVLPWMLFLVIFFVILEKAPFMPTEGKKRIAVIIAAILAFFAVNFFPLGRLLSQMFGEAGIFIAGILVIILLLGMAGVNIQKLFGDNDEGKLAVGLVLLLVAFLVLAASGFPMPNIDSTTMTLIVVLVIVGGAVLFLGAEKPSGTEKTPK